MVERFANRVVVVTGGVSGIGAGIAARLAAERAKTDAETAATRVNFFTLVRGEDSA